MLNIFKMFKRKNVELDNAASNVMNEFKTAQKDLLKNYVNKDIPFIISTPRLSINENNNIASFVSFSKQCILPYYLKYVHGVLCHYGPSSNIYLTNKDDIIKHLEIFIEYKNGDCRIESISKDTESYFVSENSRPYEKLKKLFGFLKYKVAFEFDATETTNNCKVKIIYRPDENCVNFIDVYPYIVDFKTLENTPKIDNTPIKTFTEKRFKELIESSLENDYNNELGTIIHIQDIYFI